MTDTVDAISGTLRTYTLLRDSTLRIVIDIDPRFKADFHQMFKDNDVPVAIAPLELDFERLPRTPQPKESKPLCQRAGMWPKDPLFLRWLSTKHHGEKFNEEDAAQWIRNVCGVESRSQLDNSKEAESRFHTYVRIPFNNWIKDHS
jgi:hypothetical protein